MKHAWMVYICGNTSWNLPFGNSMSQVPFFSESKDEAEQIAQEIFEKLCELNSWTPGWPCAPDGNIRVSVTFSSGKAWVAQDKNGSWLQVLNVELIEFGQRRFHFR